MPGCRKGAFYYGNSKQNHRSKGRTHYISIRLYFGANAILFRITHRGSILLYVTGCPKEAGVIFSGTALDKDMAKTLINLSLSESVMNYPLVIA